MVSQDQNQGVSKTDVSSKTDVKCVFLLVLLGKNLLPNTFRLLTRICALWLWDRGPNFIYLFIFLLWTGRWSFLLVAAPIPPTTILGPPTTFSMIDWVTSLFQYLWLLLHCISLNPAGENSLLLRIHVIRLDLPSNSGNPNFKVHNLNYIC